MRVLRDISVATSVRRSPIERRELLVELGERIDVIDCVLEPRRVGGELLPDRVQTDALAFALDQLGVECDRLRAKRSGPRTQLVDPRCE